MTVQSASRRGTLFGGKYKREIAVEAFEKLGPEATKEQVDQFFRTEYNIQAGCEKSLYYTQSAEAKRKAGVPLNNGHGYANGTSNGQQASPPQEPGVPPTVPQTQEAPTKTVKTTK
ncbi:MAG: hypothetical protein ACREGR_02195, partial [Minisyncoccia bacterium]